MGSNRGRINGYFMQVPSSIIVRGFKRDCLYDVHRHTYAYVPKELSIFLQTLKGIYIDENFVSKLNPQSKEYLSYVLEHEHAILLPKRRDLDRFPQLNMEFVFPGDMEFLIIDFTNSQSKVNLNKLGKILEIANEHGCYRFGLVSKNELSAKLLRALLDVLGRGSVRSCEIVVKHKVEDELSTNVFSRFAFLNKIVYHSSLRQKIDDAYPIIHIEENLAYSIDTRQVDPAAFHVNLEVFKQSMKENIFYSRKIVVAHNGFIKNYKLEATQYDFCNDLDLNRYLHDLKSSLLWSLSKDSIKTCCDCEHRRMCQDPAFVSLDSYSRGIRERECHYNPYIGKWRGEEGYVAVNG